MIEAPFTSELMTSPNRITVERVSAFTSQIYDNFLHNSEDRSNGSKQTPFPAKSIMEIPDLIKRVIEDYELRTNVAEKEKIFFTTEAPDFTSILEAITFSVTKRQPGGTGQGSPFSQDAKNFRPILRDQRSDPDNKGYALATLGYWHDNLIKLTCWAKSSWQASKRAFWLENIMRDYQWWLTMQGISRIFFWSSEGEEVQKVNDNKFYGKPLVYFVRDETLQNVSTKTLENVVVRLVVQGG
jgi:hypothetical protein